MKFCVEICQGRQSKLGYRAVSWDLSHGSWSLATVFSEYRGEMKGQLYVLIRCCRPEVGDSGDGPSNPAGSLATALGP